MIVWGKQSPLLLVSSVVNLMLSLAIKKTMLTINAKQSTSVTCLCHPPIIFFNMTSKDASFVLVLFFTFDSPSVRHVSPVGFSATRGK